jgi:hypothetical protein
MSLIYIYYILINGSLKNVLYFELMVPLLNLSEENLAIHEMISRISLCNNSLPLRAVIGPVIPFGPVPDLSIFGQLVVP